MQKLKYHITTISPILLVNNTGDTNMVATKEYIPGSAILGLFAGEFIRIENLSSDAHADPTFSQWFLNEGLKFTNAYIVSRDKDNNPKNINYPVPVSLQKEKKDEKKIHDLLFDESCEKQIKGIGGFGRIYGNNFYKQSVKKLLNFHHERDYEKGTSKESVIFNYESIDSEQIFEGEIIGKKDDLVSFLSEFKDENIFYIGRSRGVQYGKIKFEFTSQSPEEITSKIDNVSDSISMTFISDAIIYNKQGFSTTKETDLIDELKITLGDNIKFNKAFIKTGETENFVSVWKLRRPSEICFQMGSCFLINGLTSEDKAKLLELEKDGIGERRGEGFGRIIFNYQKVEKPESQDNEKLVNKIPTKQLPENTKKIAHLVIKDFIRKQIEIKALNEYNLYEQLPKKSLIGRLETTLMKKNRTDFIEFIDNLAKPAKEKLQNCHYGDKKLFDFLKEKFTIEVMLKDNTLKDELQKFCNTDKVKFDLKNNSDFDSELYRIYFLVFFSQMRNKLKQENKK